MCKNNPLHGLLYKDGIKVLETSSYHSYADGHSHLANCPAQTGRFHGKPVCHGSLPKYVGML
jgi:hypothetical protein